MTGSADDNQALFLQQLQNAATQALEDKAERLTDSHNASRYEVSVDALPRGLRLSGCKDKPDIDFITDESAGPQRLRVSCQYPERWSVFVKGQISLYIPVLVSRREMSAGDTPSSGDTRLEERDIGELRRGFLTSREQLENRQIARRVRTGDVLTPIMLRSTHAIQRGNRVALVVRDQGFEISMPGEALENGTLNEQIRVRNLSSGKVIQGTVIQDNVSGNTLVEVP
ncbi:MAG: flagellar basal body P-ring formation chaperone FlgA [Endozoicomonas sp.]